MRECPQRIRAERRVTQAERTTDGVQWRGPAGVKGMFENERARRRGEAPNKRVEDKAGASLHSSTTGIGSGIDPGVHIGDQVEPGIKAEVVGGCSRDRLVLRRRAVECDGGSFSQYRWNDSHGAFSHLFGWFASIRI